MDLVNYETIIVGGGLSGSQTLCELLEKLIVQQRQNPVHLCIIDQHGHFGRGIAYGNRTPPEALLIETVGSSTPKDFQKWLMERAATGLSLTAWEISHQSTILAGKFSNLHCPRHLFGDFQETKLKRLIAQARESGVALVDLIVGHVIDLEESGPQSYTVTLDNSQRLSACTVALAVGAIPRKPNSTLSIDDGYIEDPYIDGYQSITEILLKQNSHLIVIGSNASAIEIVHIIETNSELSKKVKKITTVSREGYILPGTISSHTELPDNSEIIFPSALNYIKSARDAVRKGRLITVKGTVTKIIKHPDGLRVELSEPNAQLVGQVAVNCSGAGRMHSHASTLLEAIQARLYGTANSTGRGFVMDDKGQAILGLKGAYVVGPLLNGDKPGSYVESILTVHKSACDTADTILSEII